MLRQIWLSVVVGSLNHQINVQIEAGVQQGVRPRDGGVGADGAELELVAGESEGAGAIAITAVSGNVRQRPGAEVQFRTTEGAGAFAFLDLVENI